MYADADCEESGVDGEPWYLQSCATEDRGNCRWVGYGIGSFRVFDGELLNEGEGGSGGG